MAALGLAVKFGLKINDDQIQAIVDLAVAVSVVLGGVATRQLVTPVSKRPPGGGAAVGMIAFALALPLLVACTAAQRKAVARSAVEVAAELLCSEAFAEKQGITPEQAKDLFCQNRDLLEPFLAEAMAAKQAASRESFAAAGLR
ncbi:MAG TPA: hypothetical protein VFR23_24585 [Jiangellaceae bacterium]|nr:hypothetical protein [Jiangellaceae bacterium]